MNTENKEYREEDFYYPECHGIYTSRIFSTAAGKDGIYAAAQYREDGEEGIISIRRSLAGEYSYKKYLPLSGSPFSPSISADDEGGIYVFWSEYMDGCWHLRGVAGDCTGDVFLTPDAETGPGDLLFPSVHAYGQGKVDIACESMTGGCASDIVLLTYDNGSWSAVKITDGSGIFCKRPVIAGIGEHRYIVWDGYGKEGYDIYFSECKGGIWSRPEKVSNSRHWDFNASAAVGCDGSLWVAWLRNIDVCRDGVISKKNQVVTARYKDGIWEQVLSNGGSESVMDLDLGLLPARTYFGYDGLRRQPQAICLQDGRTGIMWEMQRDEEEIWDNVENGYFCCMLHDGVKWGRPLLVRDGCCCFFADDSRPSDGTVCYGYHGNRDNGTGIKLAEAHISDLTSFDMKHMEEWEEWEEIELPAATRGGNKTGSGRKIYFGDLHCHSIYSPDAEGFPDELLFYARDKAGIDFCGITDNDFYSDMVFMDSYSRYMQSLCRCVSQDGRFLAYTGFEWTYYDKAQPLPYNWNHRSVVFLCEDQPISRRCDASGGSPEAFLKTMGGSHTMWHAHHCSWDLLDGAHDINVEVTSGWDINIESFGHIKEELGKGRAFGFIGGSDNHRFIPGNGGALAAVIADGLTKQQLYESLRTRRNYATAGSRTVLDLRVNGYDMGSAVCIGKDKEISVHIGCTAAKDIKKIEIVCGGKVIYEAEPGGSTFECDIKVQGITYDTYLYARVVLEGKDARHPHNIARASGIYAWSSPVWIKFNR